MNAERGERAGQPPVDVDMLWSQAAGANADLREAMHNDAQFHADMRLVRHLTYRFDAAMISAGIVHDIRMHVIARALDSVLSPHEALRRREMEHRLKELIIRQPPSPVPWPFPDIDPPGAPRRT